MKKRDLLILLKHAQTRYAFIVFIVFASLFLGVITYKRILSISDVSVLRYTKKNSENALFLPLVNNRPIRVLNYGDSIVQGHHNLPGSYRLRLWQAFQENSCQIEYVGSSNVNNPEGNNIPPLFHDAGMEDGKKFMHEYIHYIYSISRKYNPNYVMIYFGTADLLYPQITDSKPSKRMEDIIIRFTDALPDAHIYVSSLRINKPNIQTQVNNYNSELMDAIVKLSQNGKKVHWVDQARNLNSDDFYPNFDLHPNSIGVAKMADVWFNSMKTEICPNASDRLVGESAPVPTAPVPTAIPTTRP